MDDKRIVCWNEFVPPGDTFIAEDSIKNCIERHRKYHPEIDNDEDVLRDYMEVHWAWFKDERE